MPIKSIRTTSQQVEVQKQSCPHCHEEFREKFSPRPKDFDAWMRGDDFTELCPACGGDVVDPDVKDGPFMGWEEVDKLTRARTEKKRAWLKDHLLTSGDEVGTTKSAAAVLPEPPRPIPRTGPEAIQHALASIDLDALEAKQREEIKSGKITRRKPAVQVLNAIEGLRRNELKPEQLLLTRVPVLPPQFRPYSAMGETFIPGDANELYNDLFLVRDAYDQARTTFGDNNVGDHYLQLSNAVRAVMGYGDPVRPKTAERGVSGLMKTITGTSPKFSMLQRKMISKPVDSVSRGVITVDPELGLDEIGLSEDMAWTSFAPLVQRMLVQSGMSLTDALKNLKHRTPYAKSMLQRAVATRPVLYSRAPSWHKFNAIAGYAKLIDGDNISVNPYVTAGQNADFDGDTINVHVPIFDDSVQEAKEKLLPSRMLFSIKDPDKIMPAPKHEAVLGLNAAQRRNTGNVHKFKTKSEALQAINEGRVSLADEIDIAEP